ncbi:MAG: IS1 family transposase [Dysgonamonadaceae bacterium]|nr:IS1 family transposase [Dysgonamonadaceae bacterium]
MDCPRCKSIKHCKAGFAGGRQRHKCKECGCYYTVERKSDVKPTGTKRLALDMYLEGLGFRAISRILKISYGTVYVWVREWGSKVSLPRKEAPIPIVELDEMHTYISQKKTAVRYGLLLIDLENGTSILSVETGQQQQE